MCNNWATYGETNVSFRFADIPAAGESKIESVQFPELALVRCERCQVVRDSKRIAAYALWKTRRFALAANVRLSVHFGQLAADFNIYCHRNVVPILDRRPLSPLLHSYNSAL